MPKVKKVKKNKPYFNIKLEIVEEDLVNNKNFKMNTGTSNNLIEELPGISLTGFNTEANTNFCSNFRTENTNQTTTAGTLNYANINLVINSLKIPDAIKDLPHFDGNHRLLHDFINNVEEILKVMTTIDKTPYAGIILRAIRNKIIGQANEVLNMFGTPLDWLQIKTNLILHYSDKRNETSLIRDLHNLKQYNDSIEVFYSKIIEILSTLNNHIHIHEKDSNVLNAKTNLYSEMCLNTFLIGLKEPLGSTVRAMKPISLAEAFSYCIKEQNSFYMRHSIPTFYQNYRTLLPNKFQNSNTNLNTFVRPKDSFVKNPNFVSRHENMHPSISRNFSNQKQYNAPQNQTLFTPNNNRLPFNHKPQHNSYINQNIRKSTVTPMEVSTGYTRNTQQSNFRNSTTNNTSKNYIGKMHNLNSDNTNKLNPELFNYSNLEQFLPKTENPEPDYDTYYDGYNEIDDGNFSVNCLGQIGYLKRHSSSSLPYINILSPSGISLKFLIDTGSSVSFINPGLTNPDFHEKIEPITITTIFNKHELDQQVTLPAFKELNTNEQLKFLVFKFHSYFDGLIGLEIMKLLKSNVNIKDKLFETNNTKLPLLFKPNYMSNVFTIFQIQNQFLNFQ